MLSSRGRSIDLSMSPPLPYFEEYAWHWERMALQHAGRPPTSGEPAGSPAEVVRGLVVTAEAPAIAASSDDGTKLRLWLRPSGVASEEAAAARA